MERAVAIALFTRVIRLHMRSLGGLRAEVCSSNTCNGQWLSIFSNLL